MLSKILADINIIYFERHNIYATASEIISMYVNEIKYYKKISMAGNRKSSEN